MRLCSDKTLRTDTEIRISCNLHAHEILFFFDLSQPLKNVKTIRCLWVVQKQVVGQKALIRQYLA